MIRAGLLLAAGASRRFGTDDKLLACLRGRPLLSHAADALRQVPLDRHVAVISNPDLGSLLNGFEVVVIPQGGQSDSLKAGVAHLGRPDRLLIVLGDMPDVTPLLLSQVLARATDDGPSASHDSQRPMPPACFPRSQLPSLAAMSGDRGAGRLLRQLPPERLIAAPGQLRDIDRPDQI